MSTKSIDLANIGLMIVSCVAAYMLPFELFLFSYAVLGPLHYLTEISWLHKRDYFATGKRDYFVFIPLTLILTYLVLFVKGNEAGRWSSNLIFMCFVTGLGMVLFKSWKEKLILLGGALIVGFMLSGSMDFRVLFGIYLPTIVHVFLFTGLFIISGAIKNKSATGIASVLVFVVCGASFFLYRPILSWYHVSDYAVNNLRTVNFDSLVYTLIHTLHLDVSAYHDAIQIVFQSVPGQTVMRFIAFAYTYHYLNWFSKTSVIKWHQVPRQWLVLVLVMWIMAVGLYAIDYRLGLEVLFLLSMLHVFLEFPLNYRSIIGIAEGLGLKIPLPAPAMAVLPPAPAAKKGQRKK